MHIFSPDKYQRVFMNTKEIGDLLYIGTKPLTGHISTSMFKDEAIQYRSQNNNSMEGFSGETLGEVIPIDIDGNAEIEGALLKTLKALSELLEDLDVNDIKYHLFFSGNKGFSLYINKEYFEYEKEFEGRFNELCKAVVYTLKNKYKSLNNEAFVIDTQPYSKIGMLRAPFTINEKSGKTKYLMLPKVKGKHGEVGDYNHIGKDWLKDKDTYPILLEEIFKKIETDNKYFTIIKPTNVLTKQTAKGKYAKPYMMEHCIWTMWKDGNYAKQGRNLTGLRIGSWCGKKGFNAETTMNILREWNANIDRELKEQDLINIVKRYHKYTFNFCRDELCEQFCPKNKECVYYEPARKTEEIRSPEEAVEELEAYDKADKSSIVKWSSIFPGLQGDLNPLFGHIGTLCSSSGVGKTQVALQLALQNNHINWIFWSYEQPVIELIARCRKIFQLEGNPDWKAILKDLISHIRFIRNSSVCVQDQAIIKRSIETVNGIKISGFVVDYIGITPVRDLDTGRIINDEASSIPKCAKILKDMCVDEEIISIVLCQPTKEFSHHGGVMLEPEHIKYGQSIQSMSDGMVTLSRPNLLDKNDCIAASEVKNREGANRSVSVVELVNSHIVIPKEYTKPFTLYRTIDQWNKQFGGE